MRNRVRIFSLLAAFALLAAIAVLAVPGTAQAKAGKTTKAPVELKSGKKYKSYDITGDGKADKLKIKYVTAEKSSTGEAYAKVYVNGKKKATFKMLKGGFIYLIAPTSKNVFLMVDSYGFGFNSVNLYSWKSGKFRSAYKNSLGENELDHIGTYKLSKKELSMLVVVGKHQNFINIETHDPGFIVKYKIKKGKVTLKSRYAKIRDDYECIATAQYAWQMSSSPKENDEKGPSLVGGGKYKVLRMYISKTGKPSFELESEDGKKGWVTYDMYTEYEKPLLY
ncbi:MAG: hypothetical protein J6N77_00380 [Lachnospiraceae bacterium]|nr:hypothetical protein [Lachnospiraceae bacterium]